MALGYGWYIALGLAVAYVVFLYWTATTGRMKTWNLTLMLGCILMVRTQRGKRLLDVLAKPARLWNAAADAGIVLALVGMLLITLSVVWSGIQSLVPHSGVPKLGPSEVFVIPGVNPIVPLWYGIVGLIVTLVIHEGAHGVLARANKLTVKSMGLLFLILPVGAFVEPDEDEMNAASRRVRLRVVAAGPAVNVALAALFLVLVGAMAGSLRDTPGAHVANVTEGPPGRPTAAQAGGLLAGDTIVAMDQVAVRDWPAFTAAMQAHHPGDTVVLRLADGGTRSVHLGSFWDALNDEYQGHVRAGDEKGRATCQERNLPTDPRTCGEAMQQSAFLGIGTWNHTREEYVSAAHPFHGANVLRVILLPFAEVAGNDPVLSTYLPRFEATPFSPALFWPLFLVVFWIFWINLLVGISNMLPIMLLDGGHLFRDAMGGLVAKLRPSLDRDAQDAVARRIAVASTLVLLAAIVLGFVGPHLVDTTVGG